MCSTPRREMTVSIPLRRDDGTVALPRPDPRCVVGGEDALHRGGNDDVDVDCGMSLRTAATCLAVERVARAHRLRGLYP